MHKLLPFSPDSVVTHGDFSLDNLFFDEGKLIGCIDVDESESQTDTRILPSHGTASVIFSFITETAFQNMVLIILI
jgi:aminoglycoside 3'-phosphotransferase-1